MNFTHIMLFRREFNGPKALATSFQITLIYLLQKEQWLFKRGIQVQGSRKVINMALVILMNYIYVRIWEISLRESLN